MYSFTYKELKEATRSFSEELGRGAFGTVYKGVLPSQPRTPIAVKKLELDESLVEEAEKDFANEVSSIGQTHHKNLVRLLGFCKLRRTAPAPGLRVHEQGIPQQIPVRE